MAIPLIAPLGAFLTGWFARLLGASAIRFLALKSLLWFLAITIFPIVFYNSVSLLMTELFTAVGAVSGTHDIQPMSIQLTGMLGWFAVKLKIPECFSLILSASMFRMAINLIPFVGKA